MLCQILRKASLLCTERVRRNRSNWAPAATFSLVFVLTLLGGGALARVAPRQDLRAANVDVKTVHYLSGGSGIEAYIAAPQGAGTHPGLIVIHGNSGLNDPIKDIARRFAAAGFVAMAPDLLSRAGGTASMRGPQEASRALGQLSADQPVEDLQEGFAFLAKYPGVDASRISSVGFDWGGWRSFMLATRVPELYRAVVFDGRTPADGLQNVHAPVLANYAQFDFRVTGNAVETEERMKQMGKKFSYYVYPNAYSAFFTNSSAQYNAEAAKLAWARTLEFLQSSQ
jgi:carboxymethylenebutenolidase